MGEGHKSLEEEVGDDEYFRTPSKVAQSLAILGYIGLGVLVTYLGNNYFGN